MFRLITIIILRNHSLLCIQKFLLYNKMKPILYLSFRRVLNVIYSFSGNSPASGVLIAHVSELTIGSIFITFLFLSFRRVLNVIYSFSGNSPASGVLIADVSELTINSIFIGR